MYSNITAFCIFCVLQLYWFCLLVLTVFKVESLGFFLIICHLQIEASGRSLQFVFLRNRKQFLGVSNNEEMVSSFEKRRNYNIPGELSDPGVAE